MAVFSRISLARFCKTNVRNKPAWLSYGEKRACWLYKTDTHIYINFLCLKCKVCWPPRNRRPQPSSHLANILSWSLRETSTWNTTTFSLLANTFTCWLLWNGGVAACCAVGCIIDDSPSKPWWYGGDFFPGLMCQWSAQQVRVCYCYRICYLLRPLSLPHVVCLLLWDCVSSVSGSVSLRAVRCGFVGVVNVYGMAGLETWGSSVLGPLRRGDEVFVTVCLLATDSPSPCPWSRQVNLHSFTPAPPPPTPLSLSLNKENGCKIVKLV